MSEPRLVNNIKVDHREIKCEGLVWIFLDQLRRCEVAL